MAARSPMPSTAYQDFLSGYGTRALGHHQSGRRAALRETPSQRFCVVFRRESASPAAWLVCWESAPATTARLCFHGTRSRRSGAGSWRERATGSRASLGLAGAYHGCTLGSLSLMQPGPFTERFGPHLRGVELLPFGDEQALTQALAVGDVAYGPRPGRCRSKAACAYFRPPMSRLCASAPSGRARC